MFDMRLSHERGAAHHGWLQSKHTFSFANYWDPKQVGFSDLLVINDDTVAPSKGFGTHPHRNMEIISYVLEGALEHKDSMGTGSVIVPGDIQLMSAGRGVAHSEFNHSAQENVHFLQIWVVPNEVNTTPGYQQLHISEEDKRGKLHLMISPKGGEKLYPSNKILIFIQVFLMVKKQQSFQFQKVVMFTYMWQKAVLM